MKQILLLLSAFLLTANMVSAQHESIISFIENYKDNKAFTFAYISKDLFEVATKSSIADKDWRKVQQVVRNIGSLQILAADSLENARSVYREALDHINGSDLEELLSVQDGKERVRIWAKEANDAVTDLILLVGTPNAFVLVCFTGNLELGNLSELAALLEADEAISLAQTSKAVALDFKVFPNPTAGDFSLDYKDMNDKPTSLCVFDQNGRLLSTLSLSGNVSNQYALHQFPAGMYWFQLKTESGKVGVTPVQFVKK